MAASMRLLDGELPAWSIRGRKGGKGGGSSRAPVEAADSLFSDATAYILDALSEGEVEGWADPEHPARCIFFDGTPLENEDGSRNFSGVEFWLRTGSPDQEPVPGFSAVESQISVGVKVEAASPVARAVTNPDADAVRVTVAVPGLSDLNSSNGDLNPTSVSYAIDMQVGAAAWETVHSDTISGKTSAGYQRAVRLELPAVRPVSLRVRRLTADSGRSTLQNDIYFSTLTEIVDAKLTYPNTAYVALAISANAFGNRLPVRSYRLAGVRMLVPSNYDPATRTYDESEIWDGSLKRAWTNNPAWVTYTTLVERRWGLGERIPAEMPDRFAFYQIGKHCDELVDDGVGGLEPRYSCDGVLNQQAEAYDVVTQLAAQLRGVVYWGAGSVVPVQDAPADPVKLVTNANVEGGAFAYQGTGLAARHTAASAAWRDPSDHYALKRTVSYDDAEKIARYGFRESELTLPLTKSAGEATRACKWLVDTETTQLETVTYVAGFDHASIRPGDIVLIADKHKVGWRLGGRLLDVEAARLRLDQAANLDPGVAYRIAVSTRTGEFVTLDLAPGLGGSLEWLDLASAHGAEIAPGAVFALVTATVVPRRFRVIGNAPKGPRFHITAVYDDPDKHARVEQGVSIDTDPPYQTIPTGPLPAPSALDAVETLYRDGSAVRSKIVVSVGRPSDPRVAAVEVEVRRPGLSSFEAFAFGAASSFELLNSGTGEYRFRARAVDALQRSGPWRVISFQALSLLAPPGDVETLSVSVLDNQVSLTWRPVTDLDLAFYRIKHSSAETGATWGASSLVIEVPAPMASAVLPARSGSYLVKAVDAQGVESKAARVATVSAGHVTAINVVETLSAGAAGVWDGEHDRTTVYRGRLELTVEGDSVRDWPSVRALRSVRLGAGGRFASSGFFRLGRLIDLGEVFPVRLSAAVSAVGVNYKDSVRTWSSVRELGSVLGADPGDWAVEVLVALSLDGETFGDWSPLGGGEVSAQAIDVGLALYSYSDTVTPSISAFSLEADMPDRVLAWSDVMIPAEGLRVEFEPPFRAVPSIQVDGQGLSVGDRHVKSNVSADGVELVFINASDDPVARTADITVSGYGRRLS